MTWGEQKVPGAYKVGGGAKSSVLRNDGPNVRKEGGGKKTSRIGWGQLAGKEGGFNSGGKTPKKGTVHTKFLIGGALHKKGCCLKGQRGVEK